MSRLGQKPIALPNGTTVSVADGVLTVTGPKGTLTRPVRPEISFTVSDDAVVLEKTKDTSLSQALWGTYASHLLNMVTGVNEPFVKKLILEGVGYRVEMQGNTLVMQLGFSHPVEREVPEGLEVVVEKNNITVTGVDKELVGFFAALIRSKKKPEPYKGKGIRYADEVVRRKQGKKTA